MSTLSDSFTDVGVTVGLLVVPNQTATYGLSGTYAATLVFEKTLDGGQTWTQYAEYSTPNATVSAAVGDPGTYRWRCSSFTSGQADVTIVGEEYQILFPAITNQAGEVVFEVTSDGITTKTVTQSDPATTIDGFTGASNTGLGVGAGDSITSATATVAVGVDAGTALTSGANNTVVGKGALATATTAADSVVIGKDAGSAVTSGARNVLIGLSAGYSLANSNDNVMIGYNAGGNAAANTVRNVVVGGGAASSLNGGIDNVIVGQAAGTEIIAGNGNALVGFQAGKAQGDISNTAGFALGNGQAIYFTIDEMGNLLNIAVRYTDGTMKATAPIALV